jgi:hypothetical protein
MGFFWLKIHGHGSCGDECRRMEMQMRGCLSTWKWVFNKNKNKNKKRIKMFILIK